MTSIIHPIVAMHDASGVIQITYHDNGRHGEDGTVVDGLTTHRIYNIGDYPNVASYIDRHVWCDELGWWKEVPAKPNKYSYWDVTLSPPAWNWDINHLLHDIRIQRDQRLFYCDWTQMPDSPLTTAQKSAWATYRQELRDITGNLTGSEQTVEDAPWPSEPTT
jgi:hypothetical protein